jgi:hypothetical protein
LSSGLTTVGVVGRVEVFIFSLLSKDKVLGVIGRISFFFFKPNRRPFDCSTLSSVTFKKESFELTCCVVFAGIAGLSFSLPFPLEGDSDDEAIVTGAGTGGGGFADSTIEFLSSFATTFYNINGEISHPDNFRK